MKKISILLITLILISTLVACSEADDSVASTEETTNYIENLCSKGNPAPVLYFSNYKLKADENQYIDFGVCKNNGYLTEYAIASSVDNYHIALPSEFEDSDTRTIGLSQFTDASSGGISGMGISVNAEKYEMKFYLTNITNSQGVRKIKDISTKKEDIFSQSEFINYWFDSTVDEEDECIGKLDESEGAVNYHVEITNKDGRHGYLGCIYRYLDDGSVYHGMVSIFTKKDFVQLNEDEFQAMLESVVIVQT